MATNPYLDSSNPYLQSQVDAAQGDIMRNWNKSVQPAYNSAMVRSGSFGNAGVNEMNQNAALDTQNALGRVSDSMRSQAYNQGMQNWQYQNTSDQQRDQFNWTSNQQDRQFNQNLNQNQSQFNDNFGRNVYNDAYGQNMNNLTTGVGLLGTLAGYNANDLTNANNIQNTPYNYWSNFSNAANGMGQGYGTTTSTLGSTTNPLMSGIGGAQLGLSLYNQYKGGANSQPYNGQAYSDSPYANYNNGNTYGYTTGDNQ